MQTLILNGRVQTDQQPIKDNRGKAKETERSSQQ